MKPPPQSSAAPGFSAEEFRLLQQLIHRHSGIALDERKKEMVRGRLVRRLRAHRLGSFRDYYALLAGEGAEEELVHLLDAISTNKTDFFRERVHFDFLEKKLLPGLIREKRARRVRRIRGWCAAGSSGEEPYSVAIVLRRLNLTDPLAWDCKILATDISTRMLRTALHGKYAAERLEPVPWPEREACFSRLADGALRVKEELRSLVKFGRLNLIQENYPFRGPFDFIFCRNVMIYFDANTRERLVRRMFRYLTPGGHLFIGLSESLSGMKHPYKFVQPSVYRKPP